MVTRHFCRGDSPKANLTTCDPNDPAVFTAEIAFGRAAGNSFAKFL
jgi:hypothetical protein